jgi:hypothetical protein
MKMGHAVRTPLSAYVFRPRLGLAYNSTILLLYLGKGQKLFTSLAKKVSGP